MGNLQTLGLKCTDPLLLGAKIDLIPSQNVVKDCVVNSDSYMRDFGMQIPLYNLSPYDQ